MILIDISLIKPLRALHLLKNKEFHVSYFYLTGNYLSFNEKSILKELCVNGNIEIFELSNDFYRYYHTNQKEKFNLAITEMSSIYYAKRNNMPIVTNSLNIRDCAIKNNITVYELNEALKIININDERINYLNYMLKVV